MYVSCVGIRPKLNADDFQDLLGVEGFNVPPKSKEPQTLSDMQDVGDLKKEQDPDRAKVKQLIIHDPICKNNTMAHTDIFSIKDLVIKCSS